MTIELILSVLAVLLIILLLAEMVVYRQAIAASDRASKLADTYTVAFQQIVGSLASLSQQVSDTTDEVTDIGSDLSTVRAILEVHTTALQIKAVQPMLDSLKKSR